jgi:hypothetical protein
MAANPRIVRETVTVTWDGGPQRLVKGQVIDVPPGSALEQAIGAGRLEPLFRPGSTAIAPQAEAEEDTGTQAPAARKRAPQDKDSDEKGTP